jgi:hypothetical protein
MATPETFLTLGQAAKATNKGKGTISKAIASGKLSVASKEGNQYKIDPSELFRVFPAYTIKETERNVSNERLETQEETPKYSGIKRELELTQEMLRKEESAHAETKMEKLRLLDMLENQTRLLTHIREEADKSLQKPVERKGGFWATLLGKN